LVSTASVSLYLLAHFTRSSPRASWGEEIRSERESRTGVVREVEIGIKCDLEVAKAFSIWLQQKIAEIEKLQPAQREAVKERVL
jgi:hypothetical protein